MPTSRLFRWKIDKNEKEAEKYLQAVFKQQYQDLNPLAWQEIIVIILSIVLVILWIIRDFSSERWLFIFHKQSVEREKSRPNMNDET